MPAYIIPPPPPQAKRELKISDGFGELALLYNAPRSASVKCFETSYLWGIERNTFRRAVEEMITKEYEENRKFMEVVRFFRMCFCVCSDKTT